MLTKANGRRFNVTYAADCKEIYNGPTAEIKVVRALSCRQVSIYILPRAARPCSSSSCTR